MSLGMDSVTESRTVKGSLTSREVERKRKNTEVVIQKDHHIQENHGEDTILQKKDNILISSFLVYIAPSH